MQLNKIASKNLVPIPIAELKGQLSIIHDRDDTRLTMLVSQGIEQVSNDTNRTLVETDWELSGSCFDPDGIRLLRPPLVSVTSVIYVDTAGVEQTMLAEDYQISKSGTGAKLLPAPGKCWPEVQWGNANAVRVTYKAGYVYDIGEGSVGNIPDSLRIAVLLWAAHLDMFRESVTIVQTHELPSYMSMIASYQVDFL